MKRTLITLAATAMLLFPTTESKAQPKVPASYTFAGQTIDFDRQDFYERMDRELITFSFMHTTSILMLKRSARLFRIVEPILQENGIPDDMKYLMVIESNLDPAAVSGAGAAGLWQFMQASGRQYGLEVNANVDERYNIVKATKAACKYLKDAYNRYGDWFTVAASYNAGMGAISNRLKEQMQDSALELWQTTETSRYMYRIMAAKMMFEDPYSFGFNVTPADMYPYIAPKEEVTVTNEIPDLIEFALNHGVTYAQLKAANLWLRESKLNNASHRTYVITIPSQER